MPAGLATETPPEITESEMKTALHGTSPYKARGIDDSQPCIVRCILDVIYDGLLKIYNALLRLSYYPAVWKVALILVLRNPNRTEYSAVTAYRPKSLLPVVGKVLERIRTKRLSFHPERNPE